MRTKKKRHMRTQDHAIVELYSTFLLLGFTVIFFSAISYYVLSSMQSQPGPIVSITGKMVDNNIILEHHGGVPISLNATIGLFFNNNRVQIHAYDYVDAQAKMDGMWGFGEQVVYPIYKYYDDYFDIQQIDIMIINKDTASSIMYGSVPVEPISDLSIEITVDQQYPKMGTPIVFTITIRNNGNLNVSRIKIRFELPEGLTFSSSSATNGSYDNTTGIWDNIGKIHPGQSAALKVTTIVYQIVPSDFTQLLILQDGSGSIRKNDWDLAINGYISAIGNKSVFPQNGAVELTFVQFGGNAGQLCAQVNINPTVVTSANITSILSAIKNIPKMVGLTSTACGILCGADAVTASSFFKPENRHVVLLITDGKASSICNIDGDYKSDPPSAIDALTSAVQARNYLIEELGMTDMEDELDVIAVHVTDANAYTWFKDAMVWPQPGYFAPPFRTETPKQGFVSNISSWAAFNASLKNILTNVLSRIQIKGDIIQCSVTDPKTINNMDNIIIIPHIS